MNDDEIRDMLIEYMGKGFLENIVAMFKQDNSLYKFLPDMLGDDTIRVRLGATALVEELIGEYREEFRTAVPGIIGLLGHESPTIRGDAAYVLGILGDPSAARPLEDMLADKNDAVREAARDALDVMTIHPSGGSETG